jgi:uncharacterized membrane protein
MTNRNYYVDGVFDYLGYVDSEIQVIGQALYEARQEFLLSEESAQRLMDRVQGAAVEMISLNRELKIAISK